MSPIYWMMLFLYSFQMLLFMLNLLYFNFMKKNNIKKKMKIKSKNFYKFI
uniref:ATP synthase subunit 8 n=1 Tax=Anoecia fulviabdominalis TaxID=133068 RepID=A0A1L1YN07_9HEMI|nr:ATP synthase subunit 8 [Anoecia fulviabdominalis]